MSRTGGPPGDIFPQKLAGRVPLVGRRFGPSLRGGDVPKLRPLQPRGPLLPEPVDHLEIRLYPGRDYPGGELGQKPLVPVDFLRDRDERPALRGRESLCQDQKIIAHDLFGHGGENTPRGGRRNPEKLEWGKNIPYNVRAT